MPNWLSTKEACDYLQVSRAELYRLVKKSLLTIHKKPGRRASYYSEDELAAIKEPVPQKKEGK